MARVVCINVVNGQEDMVRTKHQHLSLDQASAKARQLNGWLRSKHIDKAVKYFTVILEDHDVPETPLETHKDRHAVVYDGIGRVHDVLPLGEAEALCAEDNDYTYEAID